MDINFEIDDDLVSDAIADAVAPAIEKALEDYDFDRPVESAVEDYLKYTANIDDVVERQVVEKLEDYDIGQHVDTNDMMVAMLEDIKTTAFARGIEHGKGLAKTVTVRPNYEELACRIDAIALWCAIGAISVSEIRDQLPLAGSSPAEVINAARSATGGTLGGGFVAGMLYAVAEMQSREVNS